MKKRILELLRQGKSFDEAKSIAIEEFENEEVEAIVKALKLAKKEIEAEKKLDDDEKAEAAEKAFNSRVEEATKKAVEKQLENAKVPSSLNNFDRKEAVSTNDQPEQWKQDTGRFIQLISEKHLNQKGQEELIDLKEKFEKRQAEVMGQKSTDAIIAGTDAAGGYFMEPKFDMEVDKLVYEGSALLQAMKMRPGSEKTLINSISTFNFVHRTDENTAFTETRPTFAQEELKYQDLGAIVGLSNRALNGSAYNLTQELTELAADAKIRKLETVIPTGKASTADPTDTNDTFKFNGIWFTSGVTTVNAINKGGTGKVTSADLHAMFLAAPAQTRAKGSFLLDSRELGVLMAEKASDGHLLKQVVNINGKFIHTLSGKEIIPVDNMERTLNSTTGYSGTDIPVIFGVLDRFRFYTLGGMRVNTSTERYFEKDQTALRFIMSYKQGIPTYSLSSFVLLLGVKYNQPS